MNQASYIIVLHQLLFQGCFVAKNVLLRRQLGQPIRGANPEANRSIAFFALFIAISLYLAATQSPLGRVALLPDVVATSACLILLCANLLVGVASLRDLGDSWRVGVIDEQQTTLIQEGIYRYTRNPYFLAYLLMFAAYTVLLQNLVLALLSCLGTYLVHGMILREEDHLARTQGDAYRAYCQRVPRYLPIGSRS